MSVYEILCNAQFQPGKHVISWPHWTADVTCRCPLCLASREAKAGVVGHVTNNVNSKMGEHEKCELTKTGRL